MKPPLMIGLALAAGAAVAWVLMSTQREVAQPQDTEGAAMVEVTLPGSWSEGAGIGQSIFEAKCSSCHGMNAVGKEGYGPPLVHKIYEPSHHADESLQRAVALGVRAHHWGFGDMAPVDGLTRGDVAMVIRYIRDLQRANGIE
ncbi:c-type cytochrome [Lutimaribacter marinistellae]|uniref:C-type cytochrome n=1 Tax=Lutimaribacter marinistellae TaxID=1820329 RepID=A0ABV7TLM1_9RHOB